MTDAKKMHHIIVWTKHTKSRWGEILLRCLQFFA